MSSSAAAHPHHWWPSNWIQPRLNVIATIQLALAALGSSWCSYQAALWGGIQATSYSEANALRVRSSRLGTSAGQFALVDVDMFLHWLEAHARGDSVTATFLERHFRPEFAKAFRDWQARTSGDRNALILPFTMPSYRLATSDSAARLDRQAGDLFARGQSANGHSDGYVFTTVLLAAVLFCAGSAQQVGPLPTRLVLVSLAAAILVLALVNIVRYPVA